MAGDLKVLRTHIKPNAEEDHLEIFIPVNIMKEISNTRIIYVVTFSTIT